MAHRHCHEALERTLRDICDSDLPWGGKIVVMGGDFRQVRPYCRAIIVSAHPPLSSACRADILPAPPPLADP